jgi:asparagine synthase (glutamine-hydrolysing)
LSGICGINERNLNLLDKAIESIKHRGNTTYNFYSDTFSLGHIGLEYRMLNEVFEDDEYIVFGDFSIYNLTYLLSLLEQNCEFNDKNESKVILDLFKRFGEDFVRYVEGNFVIAIYIKESNEILIFKDKFGIKPLYYYCNNNKFIFGSEIKCILKMGTNKMPNDQIIFDYFMFHATNHTNKTFFTNINNMPSGSILKFKDNQLNIKLWYNIEDNLKLNDTHHTENPHSQFKDSVFNSIIKSSINNAKKGCLLSGGLDSSSIITTLHKNNIDVGAFSIKFDEYRNFKDIENIDRLVEEYGFNLELFSIKSTDFLVELEKYIHVQEQPFTLLGGYVLYKAMELAKSYDTQLIYSGECADSIFSEGILFHATYVRELFNSFKLNELLTFLKEDTVYKKTDLCKSITYQIAPSFLKTLVFKKIFLSGLNKKFIDSCNEDYDSLKHDIKPNLNESLIQVTKHGLQYMIRTVEKSASAFSLDFRVPFVDEGIISSYMQLPSSEKMKEGGTKYPLKEIMKGTLIDSVRLDAKRGTILPIDRWFREIPAYSQLMQDLINSDTFKSRKYFDHEEVQEMLNSHLNNKGNYGRQLCKIMLLEYWLRVFIDN